MDYPYQKEATDSCGCVYCDLGLEPEKKWDEDWVHELYGRVYPCTKVEAPVAQEVEAGT